MAKLFIRLHGADVRNLDVEEGREYVIGRGSDCDVVLAEQRGISRQHLKIFQQDGVWTAQGLSKFVPLQVDGETKDVVELDRDLVFYAPPYEFRFELTVETAASAPSQNPNVPVASSKSEDAMTEDTVVRGNLEATVAGVVSLVPYLRINYLETDVQEVLRLEGDLWIGGRESISEIVLKDSRASRKHFELTRLNEGFFVTDLGSANGTKLNGQRLPGHEPTRLESGDTLQVLEIEMIFEVRDQNIANKLQQLPAVMPAYPMMVNPQAHWYPQLPAPHSGALPPARAEDIDWKNAKNWNSKNLKKIDWKKHKIRVLLIALMPLLLIGLFTGNQPDNGRTPSADPKAPPAFDKLTKEQKAAVKDAFNLARNLYVQGKYELCLAELAKVHEALPQYENSKELEAFCSQGKELVARQHDIDRREREKAVLENQVMSVIESCKEKLKGKGTVDQTRECLAEAMELNPDHPSVAEMISNAQGREDEAKLMAKQRANRMARSAKGESEYKKAKTLYKSGRLAKAIREYERFIDTPYPDLDQVRDTARREVASIKQELSRKVTNYLSQCKSLGEKGRYKDAYLACDKAIAEDPSNEDAKELQSRMLSKLRLEVKAIYEDSVLEESLGNVDAAKEKWKKIVAEDLAFDDYSKKAKKLLKKYGIEMERVPSNEPR